MIPNPASVDRIRIPVLAAFVAYTLLMRVLPYVLHRGFGMNIEFSYFYPWNFSAIYAIAIFGGAMLAARTAFLLPIVVFFISDVTIALLMGADWGSYRNQPITYAAFALLVLCGMPLRHRLSATRIATAGLGGAVLFFLVSNFGVWITGGGFSHPLTPAGLIACYRDGLPFFTLTLGSLAIFLPILFSPLVLTRTASAAVQAPAPAV